MGMAYGVAIHCEKYDYENSIIQFYDLGLLLQKEIKGSDNILLLRLSILLFLDMRELDSKSSLYHKCFLHIYIYNNLFLDIESKNLKLLYLHDFKENLNQVHENAHLFYKSK